MSIFVLLQPEKISMQWHLINIILENVSHKLDLDVLLKKEPLLTITSLFQKVSFANVLFKICQKKNLPRSNLSFLSMKATLLWEINTSQSLVHQSLKSLKNIVTLINNTLISLKSLIKWINSWLFILRHLNGIIQPSHISLSNKKRKLLTPLGVSSIQVHNISGHLSVFKMWFMHYIIDILLLIFDLKLIISTTSITWSKDSTKIECLHC